MPEIFEVESGSRRGQHLPNLFILDGGKGQLNILNELIRHYPHLAALTKTVQFAALGKGEARKTATIGKKAKSLNKWWGKSCISGERGLLRVMIWSMMRQIGCLLSSEMKRIDSLITIENNKKSSHLIMQKAR